MGGNEKMVILKIFKILFDYTHTACLFKKQTYLFCLLCWTPDQELKQRYQKTFKR